MRPVKRTYKFFLPGLIFILFSAASSQIARADYFNLAQPVLLDSSRHQLNFYDFGENPAGLIDDEHKKSMQIGQYGEFISGEYRLPFEASKILEQHYFVQSIQPLTENDIFKGYFAYHRQSDQNILYLDQSKNLGANPYLFADSSNGDFSLNGLYWAGEWGHRFNRNWQSGVKFYYNVDQRIKNVFPKPLNKHLNIHINYGLQYQKQSWTAGISYKYTDDQEKIEITKYNLKQDLTPTILKFRFSDLPVIDTAKTSYERKITNYGHQLSLQIKKEFKAAVLMARYSRYERNARLIDGGNLNISQGSYEVLRELAQARLIYRLSRFVTRISYDYQHNYLKARHPDFDFITWKAPSESHQLSAAFKAEYWPALPLFLDIAYAFYTENRVDLMSTNFWRFQRRQKLLRGGFIWHINKRMDFSTWAGIENYHFLNKERSDHSYSDYYHLLFEEPYSFYTGLQSVRNAAFRFIYHYGPMMDWDILLAWRGERGLNRVRNQLHFAVRTKIYIF